MYRICKSFTFEAGHWLDGLPPGHKCGRQHGHSYTAEVIVASPGLIGPGFVIDFGDLAPIRELLDTKFDHRLLNHALDVQPTSENLALELFELCTTHLTLPGAARVEAVRVRETATTWAEYRPDPAQVAS